MARLSFDIVQHKIEVASNLEKTTSGNLTTPIEPENNESGTGTTSNTTANAPSSSGLTAQSSSVTSTGSNSASYAAAAATAAASRTAKIRRVMMAARRPGGFCSRGGVIVDRARPLIPAASVPEDLIAQAQVIFFYLFFLNFFFRLFYKENLEKLLYANYNVQI